MRHPDDAPDKTAGADTPETEAEARLRRNRERLRMKLEENASDTFGAFDPTGYARLAAHVAGDLIRRHPRLALSGAALAGVWLARGRPWRLLGSSVVTGLLARQVLAFSLSSGKQILGKLIAADRKPEDRTT